MDKKLPDFELCLARAGGMIKPADLSALHGLICGLLCASPELDTTRLNRILPRLGWSDTLNTELSPWLPELLHASRQQLQDEEMGLVIWMPDDDADLRVRGASLAEWCNGVLAGLSELAGDSLAKILGSEDGHNADIAEALRDFADIARFTGQPIEAGEENEADFVQISEYCRAVVMLFQEVFRGPQSEDSIH